MRHTTYADLFGQISADDAEQDADQLFAEPAKMTISTQIEIEGLLLTVTIADTTIAEAVRLLRQRGARPAPKRAAPRRRHPTQETFDLIWSDFDDAPPTDQGARVIELAQALRGKHADWSAAMDARGADISHKRQEVTI